jgi:hypothetical protein
MRMMLKATVPIERGNAAIKDGSMGQVIQKVLEAAKAEAAYFGVDDGQRTAYIFFNMENQSDMVPLFEPLFLEMNADIKLMPVMNAEDLASGLGRLQM